MNSSLLGMWRMQHRMDLALILKALSPSLRPSLTRCTTSSGLTSPLNGNTVTKTSNEPNLIFPSLESTTQDSNTVLLFLVPRYGIHFGVCQEMRAVSDLHINHSLLGFVLDKLVGYPLYGLSVSAEKPQRQTQNE